MNIYNDAELEWLLHKLHNDSWYFELPRDVQILVDKYPPGTYFNYEGKVIYVVGYTEGESGSAIGLKMSEWHPMQNYEEAKRDSFYVCLDCLEKNILRKCVH